MYNTDAIPSVTEAVNGVNSLHQLCTIFNEFDELWMTLYQVFLKMFWANSSSWWASCQTVATRFHSWDYNEAINIVAVSSIYASTQA